MQQSVQCFVLFLIRGFGGVQRECCALCLGASCRHSWDNVMHHDDNVFPPVFTLKLHLPSSGPRTGPEASQSHHLALSGAREEGGISQSSSLISHLTKASDEDNKRSPLSRSLPLWRSLSHLSGALPLFDCQSAS